MDEQSDIHCYTGTRAAALLDQLVQDLHGSRVALQQSQEVLCMFMVPVPFKTTMGVGWGVKHVRVVCHNVSGRGGRVEGGVGGLEEVCATVRRRLNGNSWHRRSQLTTRTITHWTKKPMEKQHRIYVIGV